MSDSPRPRDDADGADGPDGADGVPRRVDVRDEAGADDEDPRLSPSDADRDRPPLTPGSPSAENVLFVLVGVTLTLLILFSAFLPVP